MSWQPGQTLEQVEMLAIQSAYKWFKCNKTHTASALGISIRTLDVKLENYDADARERDATKDRERQARAEEMARQRGLSSPAAGIRLESFEDAASKSTLSLPERSKVQKVLHRQASKGHS